MISACHVTPVKSRQPSTPIPTCRTNAHARVGIVVADCGVAAVVVTKVTGPGAWRPQRVRQQGRAGRSSSTVLRLANQYAPAKGAAALPYPLRTRHCHCRRCRIRGGWAGRQESVSRCEMVWAAWHRHSGVNVLIYLSVGTSAGSSRGREGAATQGRSG